MVVSFSIEPLLSGIRAFLIEFRIKNSLSILVKIYFAMCFQFEKVLDFEFFMLLVY